MTSLATMLPAVALLCLITGWRVTGTTATRIRTRAHRGGPDRGATALEWAALAVGAVLIAGAVLAAMNQAGEEIAGNVCTNADPSTC